MKNLELLLWVAVLVTGLGFLVMPLYWASIAAAVVRGVRHV